LVASTPNTSAATLESLGDSPLSAGEVSYTSQLEGSVANPPQDSIQVEVSGYMEYIKAADLIEAT